MIRAAVDSSERGCLVAFDGGVLAVVKRVEAEAEALSVLREQLAGRMAIGEWIGSDGDGVDESVGDDDGSVKTVGVAVGVDVLVRIVGECWRVVGSCSEDPEGVYRDWETDRKSTRLNSSHRSLSRMPSSA